MQLIRAKILLTQDKNYKKRFKFDHVWPILKDIQKFAENDSATSAFERQSGYIVSSQEDSPTLESLTSASSELSSFSLNITNDDVGGSLSQWPVRVKKAIKRTADEQNSKILDSMEEGSQQLLEVFFFFLEITQSKRKLDMVEFWEENKI